MKCLESNLMIPEEEAKDIIIENSHMIPKNPFNTIKPVHRRQSLWNSQTCPKGILQLPTIPLQSASAGETHVHHETDQSSFFVSIRCIWNNASLNSVAPLHPSAGYPFEATVPIRIKKNGPIYLSICTLYYLISKKTNYPCRQDASLIHLSVDQCFFFNFASV